MERYTKSRERQEKFQREESHDMLIEEAKMADKTRERTDAYAQGDGYLGMDDLDRLRREKLK